VGLQHNTQHTKLGIVCVGVRRACVRSWLMRTQGDCAAFGVPRPLLVRGQGCAAWCARMVVSERRGGMQLRGGGGAWRRGAAPPEGERAAPPATCAKPAITITPAPPQCRLHLHAEHAGWLPVWLHHHHLQLQEAGGEGPPQRPPSCCKLIRLLQAKVAGACVPCTWTVSIMQGGRMWCMQV